MGQSARVVVSDTESVLLLAKTLGMFTTSDFGKAVHLGMASANHTRDAGRLFLDWWLLRRAKTAGTFDWSSLLVSARWYHGDAPTMFAFPHDTNVPRTGANYSCTRRQ